MKSIDLIKRLRQLTGSPIVHCKAAIEACDSDIDKSVEWLRLKGHASVQKKAGLTVSHGLIGLARDETRTAMVEVLCETDFVAKNEQFMEFANAATNSYLDMKDVDEELEDRRAALIHRCKENVEVRRKVMMAVDPGTYVASYLHNSVSDTLGKTGCLLKLTDFPDAADAGERLCMQVVAGKPSFLHQEQIPDDFITRQREIILNGMDDETKEKPAQVVEKIISGKLQKALRQATLLDQVFLISDDDKEMTVAKWLKNVGNEIKVEEFVSLNAGEDLDAS